jgi:hypothetical protein
MANMAKGTEERRADGQGVEQRSRRKRGTPADSNHAFVRAFADALRDILHHERRRAA